MPAQGQSIARAGTIAMHLKQMLLDGVAPGSFARQPPDNTGQRVQCNHPAFVVGHLSLYPARALDMLGVEHGPAAIPDGFEQLFSPGAACHDDPDGSIYPEMDQIVSQYDAAHQTLLDTLPNIDDATFAKENPIERMRDRLGLITVGDACNFLLTGHTQFHLGQISTWRRAMGLGSAM